MAEMANHDEEYILNNFIKDMPSTVFFRRPLSKDHLWAFWCETTLSPFNVGGGITDWVTHSPTTNQGIVIEKIKSALQNFHRNNYMDHTLIQFWTPITTETGCFQLVTSDQPFALSYDLDERLLKYRKHCLEYEIDLDGTEEHLGIQGRVFRKKLHERTEDVRIYSSKEYPQREFALTCNIWASSAFPLFHPSFQGCVGVLEFVKNTPSGLLLLVCYSLLDYLLKIAGLRSSLCYCHRSSYPVLINKFLYYTKFTIQIYRDTNDEIYKGLQVMCKKHKLPLAQMWIPCRFNTLNTDGNMDNSSSNTFFDVSCVGQVLHGPNEVSYLVDYNLVEFSGLCASNDLQRGQGVVGRAYLSHKPCFCRDITQFSLTEYPLLPGARHFGLTGCFSISLRSCYTREVDYVLEFFLNRKRAYGKDTSTLLCSMLETMKQHFPSFKLSSGEELGKELSIYIITPRMNREPTRSPSGPGVLHSEQEMMQPHSSNQQLTLEVDTCSDDTYSITYEELEQHFGKKLEDIANVYGVSRSTFKRICRKKGIRRWKRGKRNKVDDSPSRLDPPCSDLTAEKLVTTFSHITPLVITPQEASTMTIKATCGDDMIKFQIHFSAKMVELEEEVSKRLKFNVGIYKIKYIDDDGDRILIACDKDLQDCISASNSLGMKTIKMFIEPITQI
ncbi:protein NLP6-like [Cornus florida]|uniref:protein NLP6-like n=1 Tax=Cornus florida TaxID=4283 RepID=UPI0028A2C554|nr:protein NLP6-like [Cornus florida]